MVAAGRHVDIGRTILEIVKRPEVVERLAQATAEAKALLAEDPDRRSASVPLALSLFGGSFPSEIRSCRLSTMRARRACRVERHPNSTQYVLSVEGTGTIRVRSDRGWEPSELRSDARAPLSARWHTVPADTWHQPRPGEMDWTVVAFHGASAKDLIDVYED